MNRERATRDGSAESFTIWVNLVTGLAATDVSAVVRVTSAPPILVGRAMCLDRPREHFSAGHVSTGVWAWRATGQFFDLFVLVASPGGNDARVSDRPPRGR